MHPDSGGRRKRKNTLPQRSAKVARARGPERNPLQMYDIMLMFSQPTQSLSSFTEIVDTRFYNSEYFSDAVIFRQLKILKDYQNPALIIRAKMKAISQQLDVYSVASTNTSWFPD
jgi:hypothetical protein